MGAVWLATRHDREYQKKVAIKMVKRGMDSQEILRRFRTERQVLAGLEHPNIARLLDGGTTPDGMPYLVMEYVEGTPIDQYCERNKRSITDRLQLFRAVCAAVQFAHQNLVVHRDIKTGNILVTADGTAKLLDFGIAKLLSPASSTLDLAQTRPGMRPMTVDYASPEQIRGRTDHHHDGCLFAGSAALPAAHRKNAVWRRSADAGGAAARHLREWSRYGPAR